MQQLYYVTPSDQWIEGLPIGNGRLAAMVWGSDSDRLTLNHEWLWTGRNRNRKTECTAQGLPMVRQFIRQENHYMATMLANALFGGVGGKSGIPARVDDYQPAGELTMAFSGSVDFQERKLDIATGTAEVHRLVSGAQVHSEAFADCRNGCLELRWTGSAPFDGTLSISREAEEGTTLKFSSGRDFLRMDGSIAGGIRFAVRIRVRTDGDVHFAENRMELRGATYLRCSVNIATDHEDLEKELSACPGLAAFPEVLAAHSEKFRQLMEGLDFGLAPAEEDLSFTTDQRIARVKEGAVDNGISQLYFDFGRYLLISSSICGQLPANLQGKWNDSLTPPWNCDYHFDINLQMNYWMAEPAGLTDCARALIRFLRSFIPSGKEAAQRLYGCRGIFLPIQTDAWGISTPEAFGWAVWIGAAPWCCRHLWEHYRYTGDLVYLRDQAYEFLKLTAEFYEDYLQKDETGTYQILPSQSPENTIAATGQMPVLIGQSSAMDVQLCYESLGYAIRAAEILQLDAEQAEKWKQMQQHLPPFAVGSDGRLLEWQKEYPEREPGHRHLSHLYGLYPADLFTPCTRPEQYDAAIRSFRYRLSHGGGHTGWSRAWSACIAARIGDAQEFYRHFTAMIQTFATSSLLDLHPPRIFQIEGNLGAVAAVMEAIVSFFDGAAHLLRGLPSQWHTGHMNGVRLPGGHILSVSWENGRASSVSLVLGFEGQARIEWDGTVHTVTGEPGQTVQLL